MSKYSRGGGKYTGKHTTLIPAAAALCDAIHGIPEVLKISLGFIKAGLRSANGNKRVKVSDCGNGYILLSVRDNNSHQQIHVYTTHTKTAMPEIAAKAVRLGMNVSSHEP